MTAIIKVSHLTKKFKEYAAVNDVSFEVEQGEVFGLLGPNGAGKSTTIKMLTTLLRPTSGEALVNGFDIVRQTTAVRHSIGYVPQALSADGSLSGYEIFRFSRSSMMYPTLSEMLASSRSSRMLALRMQVSNWYATIQAA